MAETESKMSEMIQQKSINKEQKMEEMDTDSQLLPNLSSLTLSDSLSKIDDENRFEWNYRLVFCLIGGIVFMCIGNPMFFGFGVWIRWVYIVFFTFILVGCIVLLICGRCFSEKKLFLLYFSKIMGLEDSTDDLFVFEGAKDWGWVTVSAVIYGSIVALLLEVFYRDILYDATKCENMNKSDCIAVFSTFSQTYPFIGFLYLMIRCRKVKCSEDIDRIKKELFATYKMAKTIDDRVRANDLQKWNLGKRYKARWNEFIFLFLGSFILIWVTQGFLRHEITKTSFKNDHLSLSFVFIFYFCDALYWALTFYFSQWIMVHSQFAYVTMKGLLSPININEADDLIAWWKLRKFYIDSIGNIYSYQISVVIFVSLVATCIANGFLFITLGSVPLSMTVLYAILSVLTVYTAFVFVTNAVSYHSVQLLHVGTMNEEKIRLTRMLCYNDQTKDKNENITKVMRLLDLVIFDIERRSVPISVMGVNMEKTFILFLRATVITFVLVLVTVIFAE